MLQQSPEVALLLREAVLLKEAALPLPQEAALPPRLATMQGQVLVMVPAPLLERASLPAAQPVLASE